jgi:hypothetical protein
MAALVRIERPQTVWTIGRLAKVNVGYAQEALPRMADWKPDQGDAVYAVVRRRDLGSACIKRSRSPLDRGPSATTGQAEPTATWAAGGIWLQRRHREALTVR